MTAVVQLAALAMFGIAAAVWVARIPSARRPRERPHPRPRRTLPGDLGTITELVAGGAVTAGDLHRRVRPLLREIAGARLSRSGVGLDRDQAQARALLGEPLWELVRPGRPLPVDRDAPGLSLAQLSDLTDRLEAL